MEAGLYQKAVTIRKHRAKPQHPFIADMTCHVWHTVRSESSSNNCLAFLNQCLPKERLRRSLLFHALLSDQIYFSWSWRLTPKLTVSQRGAKQSSKPHKTNVFLQSLMQWCFCLHPAQSPSCSSIPTLRTHLGSPASENKAFSRCSRWSLLLTRTKDAPILLPKAQPRVIARREAYNHRVAFFQPT